MARKLLQTKKARAARARYRRNKGKRANKSRRKRQKGEGFFEDVGNFFTQNVLPILPTVLPMLL